MNEYIYLIVATLQEFPNKWVMVSTLKDKNTLIELGVKPSQIRMPSEMETIQDGLAQKIL